MVILNYWSRRAITLDLKTRTRDKLLKRQNYKCSVCGKTFLPFDIIATDHITPITKRGSHKITNLQLLHAYIMIERYKKDFFLNCAKRNSFPSIA